MPDIEIHLLGRFYVSAQGQEVEESRWTRKKAKTLVKLLAVSPQRRMLRERAAEILWPEMEAEAALANLHKAIHAARRALEPNLRQGAASRFLFSQDGQVSLAAEPELSVDWDQFETQGAAALKRKDFSDCESALRLYAGDLLPEDLYEDFCLVPREHARSLCERLLEQISHQREALEEPELGQTLEHLLRLNPVNEDARRRLMRLYLKNGQRHLALDQYRQCAEALKAELDAEPEKATKLLFEQILAGDPALQSPVLSPLRPLAAVHPAAPVLEGVPTVAPSSSRRKAFWVLGGAASLAAVGLLWRQERVLPKTNHAQLNPVPLRSLAILPIRTLGNGQEEQILAEGITEGLINSISRLAKLRVMARATVFSYQQRTDTLAIGRELKVTQILNGRLEKEGNAYRLALELVDVSDGARVWGRQFFSPVSEIQTLQQTLNSELSAVLEPPVETGPARPAAKRRNPIAGAYQLYLNGRYFANQRSGDALKKARGFFEQAIALDPEYALAHAGLADSLGLLGVSIAKPQDLMPLAKSAAERAISLDESLAEAHTSLAMVYALYEWNWPRAEESFRRAIGCNEGYTTAHHWYGVNLAGQGRFRQAEQELSKAVDLDPLSPIILLNRGYPLYYQKRYSEAMVFYQSALDLKPNFQTALEDVAIVEHLLGQEAKASASILRLLQPDEDAQFALPFNTALTKYGYTAALRYLVGAYEVKAQKDYVSPMKIASLAVRAGDRRATYVWLERAYQQRAALLTYIAVDPIYSSLRLEPEFRNLVQRLGLPAA